MRFVCLSLSLVVSACAARPPEPKLRYSDVFRAPERIENVSHPSAKVEPAPAATSLELQAALVAFAHRSRKNRAAGRDGAIPSEQIQNWDAVMTAVDELLAKPVRQTSSYDVIRSRVTLEAELEMDVRAYEELPDELWTAIELRKARLGFRMAEVRRKKVKPHVARPDFIWPVSPVAVTSLFGPRLHPISRSFRPHQGIDLAAGFGQEVYAAATGTVVQAEWVGGHGNYIQVQHHGNIVTTYSHLADILVEPGTVVKQGQPIGLAGSTGLSTGVHLHFELHVGGKPMDPLDQMSEPQDRTVPLALR